MRAFQGTAHRRQDRSSMTPMATGGVLAWKRWYLIPFKLALSAILIWLIGRSVADPQELLQGLLALDWPLFVVSVLVFLLGQLFAVGRLAWCLAALCRRVPYSRCLQAHMTGLFFNQALPTGIGGDIVKILLLRRRGHTTRVLRAVLGTRVLGMGTLMAFTFAAGLVLLPSVGEEPSLAALAGFSGLSILGLGLACWLSKTAPAQRARRIKLGRVALMLLSDIRRMLATKWALRQALASCLVVLSVCLTFMLLFLALGERLPLLWSLALSPVVVLAMHLPLSYAGWGIREASAVALFPLAGMSPNGAFSVSLLYGIVLIASGIPGLFAWLGWRHSAPSTASGEAPESSVAP